jgi:hypothetical protein
MAVINVSEKQSYLLALASDLLLFTFPNPALLSQIANVKAFFSVDSSNLAVLTS